MSFMSDWKAENSIPFIPLIFNNVNRLPPVHAHSVMLASSKWCCRLVVSSAQWAGCNNLMIMIKIIGVRIILLLLLSSSPHTRIQNSVLSFDFPLSLNIQVHSPILLRFPGTLNQKFDKKIKSNRPQIIRIVVKSALIQFQPNSSSVTIYNVWHKNAQRTAHSSKHNTVRGNKERFLCSPECFISYVKKPFQQLLWHGKIFRGNYE